jgi:voltage-gated potassium channel
MSNTGIKVLKAVAGFCGILVAGVVGYMCFENISFVDALYMTVITISTVGYGDMVPIHTSGKIFTVFMVLGGVGYVMYMFSKIMETVIEGGLRELMGKRLMAKELARLKDHYIVCGFGRIGKVICETLDRSEIRFAVIESDPNEFQNIVAAGYNVIKGDASEDDILNKAGINNAKGLIAVVSSDADNVFITLTAKGLNPDIFILARSSGTAGAKKKLKRAGADCVISPYTIGGMRMAHSVIRPNVIDFLEASMAVDEYNLQIEELCVGESADLKGKTLMDSNIRKSFDIIVVGIKRGKNIMLFNPKPDTVILGGDILIVLGKKGQIANLKQSISS